MNIGSKFRNIIKNYTYLKYHNIVIKTGSENLMQEENLV